MTLVRCEGVGNASFAIHVNAENVAGPFFLGFVFTSFAMGIVVTLSINYFTAASSHYPSPADSSKRLGMILVALTLAINMAQTIVDWRRGWVMFGADFLNLSAFLHPNPLYFISPFLGLLPALITQLFLLRRGVLFISSLSPFWPRLAHPVVRWGFSGIMGGMIIWSAISGTFAAYTVWRSEGLWMLARDSSTAGRFQRAELCWLGTSAAVDIVLSGVLCSEMWWARKHLAAQGGLMRKVVMRTMLVTFNGGLAATVIQLSVLCLYQFARAQSWCYFPMLWLPKLYTITLLLSLAVPNTTTSPGHMFSLPRMNTSERPPSMVDRLPLSRSQVTLATPMPRASSPTNIDGVVEKRKSSMTHLSNSIRASWNKHHLGSHPIPEASHGQQVENLGGRTLNRLGDRRPSEPNSLAPLLEAQDVNHLSELPTEFSSRTVPFCPCCAGSGLDASHTSLTFLAGGSRSTALPHPHHPPIPNPVLNLTPLPPSFLSYPGSRRSSRSTLTPFYPRRGSLPVISPFTSTANDEECAGPRDRDTPSRSATVTESGTHTGTHAESVGEDGEPPPKQRFDNLDPFGVHQKQALYRKDRQEPPTRLFRFEEMLRRDSGMSAG